MSLSDKIIATALKSAIEANKAARITADLAVKAVHDDTTNVHVCSAHAALVALQVAHLGYTKAISEGLEVLLTSGMTMLEERIEKRNWTAVLTYVNLVLFTASVLMQIFGLKVVP